MANNANQCGSPVIWPFKEDHTTPKYCLLTKSAYAYNMILYTILIPHPPTHPYIK